ncbi:MAG: ATP-binding protein [Actinomycetota bacterium]
MSASLLGLDSDTADVVELEVPASAAYIAVVRTAAAGLAARVDLTLDRIEDLRIAVDEACALLVQAAEHGPGAVTTLRCVFVLEEPSLTVEVSGPRTDLPDRAAFAWSVLSALVDGVESGEDDGRTWLRLVVRRGSGQWG